MTFWEQVQSQAGAAFETLSTGARDVLGDWVVAQRERLNGTNDDNGNGGVQTNANPQGQQTANAAAAPAGQLTVFGRTITDTQLLLAGGGLLAVALVFALRR